ncbi:hypothetical protein F2Q68_00036818 [Brassica cretica]|uniref:Cleavage and polyadenylation specificity factor subunit 2 n=1 Tax=Brassica cretica TaxID=69181 RepID=A0A8S9H3W6_BRACR|nr:hypothetical protein F2Q68_00036818 [Brassica cretica]
MASLEAGFARDIFVEWANDPRNLVLFTETGQFGTLARMLQSAPSPKFVKVTMSKRVPLAGEELIAYEEEQNRLKREEALRASLVKEEETKVSHGPDDNSSEPMVIDTKTTHDVVGSHGPAYKDILIDGFVPPSSSVAPMFPFYDNTADWDEYGEVINPDDYVIKDEDMDRGAMHVQLSEKLMSNVIFKKLGDSEVAWVDSEVGKTESEKRCLQPMASAAAPHKPVLVGDLKMQDFKQFLASKGVQVEFAGGGALRCGEYVTLRKVGPTGQKGGASGPQQILIEGPLCEDYYKIRDYLYSQFYLL